MIFTQFNLAYLNSEKLLFNVYRDKYLTGRNKASNGVRSIQERNPIRYCTFYLELIK